MFERERGAEASDSSGARLVGASRPCAFSGGRPRGACACFWPHDMATVDDRRQIEVDRNYRKQVRRAWYLRRHDFESDQEYNDYLEQVEDLVDALVNERTRPAARQQLDQLKAKYAAQTAHNLRQHETEWEQRDNQLEQERQAKLAAAQERLEAEARAVADLAKQRLALQDGIQAGTTTVSMARENLSALRQQGVEAAAAAVAGASAAARMMPPPPAGRAAYAPAAPAPAANGSGLVQPVDLEAALALFKAAPAHMLFAVKSQAEAYELDPKSLARAYQAAGYDRELWRQRYRQEALCSSGVHFRMA